MDNYTLDTAARFGEIPFVDFTKDLVTGVFECLLEAHAEQMENYATFLNSLTQDLSTYINNTVDNVSFSDVSSFVLNYSLPKVDDATLGIVMGALQPPTSTPNTSTPTGTNGAATTAAQISTATAEGKWWQGLISSVGPAISGLMDKIKDPNLQGKLNAITDYNAGVLGKAIPSYDDIQSSIAALISSNKYALLQNMAKQGMLRLVVTEGEIETKITFSTWNNSSSGTESFDSQKDVLKTKNVKASTVAMFFRKKDLTKNRTVTVNTAKSYQRDSSGSRVDIFGRVLIRFKTDYEPLNG